MRITSSNIRGQLGVFKYYKQGRCNYLNEQQDWSSNGGADPLKAMVNGIQSTVFQGKTNKQSTRKFLIYTMNGNQE